MYIFNDKFKKLIMLQITTTSKDMGVYSVTSEREYDVIEKYLFPYPKKILELGCGLGRMSICLNKKNPSAAKYYLADTSIVSKNTKKYGWNPSNIWYNDLELTKEFCVLNGLKNFKTIDLLKDDLCKLKDINLAFSFLAVGFHYPIEEYLEILKQIMTPDGLLIFGVRRGIYENSPILSKFNFSIFHDIQNNKKEKVLVLKGWR